MTESPSPSSSLPVEDETGPREGRGLGAVPPLDDPSPPLSQPLSPPSLQVRPLASLSSLVALLLGEPGQPGPQLERQDFLGGLTYPVNTIWFRVGRGRGAGQRRVLFVFEGHERRFFSFS